MMEIEKPLIFEDRGTFDFDGGAFDPNSEDVTITFGECTDPSACTNVEFTIAAGDFERDDGQFEAESEDGDGEIEVGIRADGRYEISMDGIDVDGIDLSFVSFTIQIGDQVQGVGLEFNEDGECIHANGSGGCQGGDDDE